MSIHPIDLRPQDTGASADADRAATPSEPSPSVSGKAGIPCAFTPGPWRIEPHAKFGDTQMYWVNDFTSVGTQVDGDVSLIAAAPELYGQLESGQTDLDLLRRAIEENDPKAELLIRVTDLWKRNEAALVKARGAS